MEDLAPAAQGNQMTGCDATQARTAVLELAKLHGPRWGDPTLDDIEWLSRRTARGFAAAGDVVGDVPARLHRLPTAATCRADATELIDRFGQKIVGWVDGRESAEHGHPRRLPARQLDVRRCRKVAHRSPPSTGRHPGHGLGITDVSYFLGAGVLPEERRRIERELVDQYGQALADYGVAVDADDLWQQYRRDAYAGIVMSVIASQIVGSNERSEAMFAAMATRHAQHAIDLESESLL